MDSSDGAHDLHRLVLIHGRERARQMVDVKTRPLVDIAAEVLADDTQRIGISYTGFCLTALPHKKLANDEPWEKKGHRVTLLVEFGRLKHAGKTKLFGVPYSARARMILLYLQTQAIRTSSREVALGVPPAVLRFYTVRSLVCGRFWPEVDASLRNVRFMACYRGVQCGMHAMFRVEARYCTP